MKVIYKVLISLWVAIGLTISPEKIMSISSVNKLLDYKFSSWLYYLFNEFARGLVNKRIETTFIVIFMFILLSWLSKNTHGTTKWQKVLAVFLAFMAVIGRAFYVPNLQEGTWTLLVENPVQIIKTIVIFGAWLILFEILQRLLVYVLELDFAKFQVVTKFETSWLGKKITQAPFWSAFFIFIIIWTPLVLIDYPAVVTYDGLVQIIQYTGESVLRNDHPIIATAMLGEFVDFGRAIGIPNVGLFLYAICQTVILAILLSFTVWVVYKIVKKPLVAFSVNLLYGLAPMVSSLISVSVKDILFSGFFTAMTASLAYYLYDQKAYKKERIYLVSLLTMTLAILFRKNSLYALLVVVAVAVVFVIIQALRGKRQHLMILPVIILPFFLSSVIESQLVSHYKAESSVLRQEMFSVPFQQTARYVKTYGDEVTPEERKNINALLDYDHLAELYYPIRSDAVKESFKNEATREDFKNYFGTWFAQLTKHPAVYFEATFHQIFALFTIYNNHWYYTTLKASDSPNTPWTNERYELYDFKEVKLNRNLQHVKESVFKLIDALPVINYFNNFSVYIILMLMLIVISMSYNLLKSFTLMSPALLLLGTLILGPVMIGYIRYYVPYLMMAPVFLVFVKMEFQKQVSQTKAKQLPKIEQ